MTILKKSLFGLLLIGVRLVAMNYFEIERVESQLLSKIYLPLQKYEGQLLLQREKLRKERLSLERVQTKLAVLKTKENWLDRFSAQEIYFKFGVVLERSLIKTGVANCNEVLDSQRKRLDALRKRFNETLSFLCEYQSLLNRIILNKVVEQIAQGNELQQGQNIRKRKLDHTQRDNENARKKRKIVYTFQR